MFIVVRGGLENRKNWSGEQIGKAQALESGRSFQINSFLGA